MPIPLDPEFPIWGDSRYLAVTLTATVTLQTLLEHLFVLLPVLDDDKHYWVGDAEVDKLLRRGGAWLAAHPEREFITRRYLRYDRRLTRDALARLMAVDDDPDDPDGDEAASDAAEAAVERPLSLNQQRLDAVVAVLRDESAHTVVDLGCGEGQAGASAPPRADHRPRRRRRRVVARARVRRSSSEGRGDAAAPA